MTPSITGKTHNLFGLNQGDLQNIIAVIKHQLVIEEAVIFGSRAKGNYKTASDIDIALKGTGVNHTVTGNISYILNEETQMPYKFDVINYNTLINKDLAKHIDRAGICFYKKGIDSSDVLGNPTD